MPYRELLPPPALRPFVDRFWVGGSDTAVLDPAPKRILPDGCIDVLVDVGRARSARVVGTMTRAAVFSNAAHVSVAAVRFKPGGAAPFLRLMAHELTDRVVSVEELGLRWLDACEQSLPNASAVLDALERGLLTRLHQVAPIERRVQHAVASLLRASPPTIADLAGALGWSRQHLGRVFREQVGVAPKEFARIARLQRAVHRLQQGRSAELARAALELGYFDQAHMARDLRAIAGLTAVEVRRAEGSIFPIQSLWLEA